MGTFHNESENQQNEKTTYPATYSLNKHQCDVPKKNSFYWK